MNQPPSQAVGPAAAQNGANNKKTPVEFNHAINYVHKIKVCADCSKSYDLRRQV